MTVKKVGPLQDELIVSDDAVSDESSIADGYALDIITGDKQLKDTPKEQVRQRIARALWHEYGFSLDDMQSDFPVKVDGKRKRIDIAIFHAGKLQIAENVSRVVVCRPEPKVGPAGMRIRDYEQAHDDLEELETIMEALQECKYGLWTNALELFFLVLLCYIRKTCGT